MTPNSPSMKGRELQSQDREELLQTTRHLLAEVQALSSRIAAVNEIATAINRSLNLDEILRIVGKQAKWLLDFEHLSVYICHRGSCRFVRLFGPPVEFDDSQLAPTNPIGCAMKTKQPQLIRERVAQSPETGSTIGLDAYTSLIAIPLESERQVIGTINFATKKAGAYTHEDVRIGYLLALQLSAAIRNAERFEELNRLYAELEESKQKSDKLLLNILPLEIADELKQEGKVKPVYYESASVLFTDFKGFTQLAEQMTPEELVGELDYCFSYFDRVIDKYNLEKLKTIGDSYMCAGGIPTPNRTHAIDAVLAALEIQTFMYLRKAQKLKNNQPYWDIRIGIHSGPLLAGVIGRNKFAYDVWGDTVNTASRMESSGIPGRVNISRYTFELTGDLFKVDYRGKIQAKNKGEIDMYLVEGLKEGLSTDPVGLLPNDEFMKFYLDINCGSNITAPFCYWTLAPC
ncbi:adenylate/guanylate cyclase domain-containing protein [Kamptonema formosum]|uniref:adenylate/guanylate cyclase domain-containing protein n=1 Tax=Kamptonema formosum TaxID=331992 RepID=UPI0003491671|nr:adenylate/guanylate cyclase domain-containing protein [Oscillatoria sp. PCC 10802]